MLEGFVVFVWQHRWGTSQFQREKIYLCEGNVEKPKEEELGGGVLFLPRSSILSSLTGFLISGLFHPAPSRGQPTAPTCSKCADIKYMFTKRRMNQGGYLWKKSYLFAVFVVLFLQLCVTALFMWL